MGCLLEILVGIAIVFILLYLFNPQDPSPEYIEEYENGDGEHQ